MFLSRFWLSRPFPCLGQACRLNVKLTTCGYSILLMDISSHYYRKVVCITPRPQIFHNQRLTTENGLMLIHKMLNDFELTGLRLLLGGHASFRRLLADVTFYNFLKWIRTKNGPIEGQRPATQKGAIVCLIAEELRNETTKRLV